MSTLYVKNIYFLNNKNKVGREYFLIKNFTVMSLLITI
jgi:hypothetical protein